MTSMKSSQKILITAGTTFAFAGVLLGGAVYPIFQGIVKDYETMLERRQELLQIAEDRKQLRDFEDVSLQYKQEFLELESLFVDRETPVPFFRFLDQAALQFGLQIEKAPDDPRQVEGDVWPSLEVRLVGSGLYSDFLAFLQTIENAPYIVEVQKLDIKKSGGSVNDERVEFSMSVKAFVR